MIIPSLSETSKSLLFKSFLCFSLKISFKVSSTLSKISVSYSIIAIGFLAKEGSFLTKYFLWFRFGSETSLRLKDYFFFLSFFPPDFPLLPNYLSLLLMPSAFLDWGVFTTFVCWTWFRADFISKFLSL